MKLQISRITCFSKKCSCNPSSEKWNSKLPFELQCPRLGCTAVPTGPCWQDSRRTGRYAFCIINYATRSRQEYNRREIVGWPWCYLHETLVRQHLGNCIVASLVMSPSIMVPFSITCTPISAMSCLDLLGLASAQYIRVAYSLDCKCLWISKCRRKSFCSVVPCKIE